MDTETITKTIELLRAEPNLKNYEVVRETFDWKTVEKELTWHKTGKYNIAYEAIDRHADGYLKNTLAFVYVDENREEKYSYADMKKSTNKAANTLKGLGVKKGDRVVVFMSRSPELYFTFLGALKLGAIVVPLFEAFMKDAVKDRTQDCEASVIVTTQELKERIPLAELPTLQHVVVQGEGGLGEKEVSWDKLFEEASEELSIEWLSRDDPYIIHYTSGSTGKPKGVVHRQYAMIGHLQTSRWSLDLKEDDVYFCTADPGWVTGTSYGIFAPWLNGVTNVVSGGRFSVDKWLSIMDKLKVTVWYSAPTAFRLFMAADQGVFKKYDMSSLRHICSVGEPLNPEVIRWGLKTFNLVIHDNWWMTETGMQLIANYPAMDVKLGSMGKPVPGVVATIIDDDGNELPPMQVGNLAVRAGWPSMMIEIWKNQEKYQDYFKNEPWYTSGDSAYMDTEGYFWFVGRIDDVIKTSGERVGPFEVESKLVEHPAVAEAGVIGKPDQLRGAIVKAFITLREGYTETPELIKEIQNFVKKELAAHAYPREIEIVEKLPKTRSGKIMRRVLLSRELGQDVGDVSTMDD